MTVKREQAATWHEWFVAWGRYLGPRMVWAAREFLYGIDTWSSVTHGLQPAERCRTKPGQPGVERAPGKR
ncbi:hypothetical protein [Haloechinothrix sp. LS1_15]|uniref:hypothetical protein n=1 Tax=Haloechinothrix sp. LS1_15 TaxID=2652248 RepID=UPI002947AFB5|nr:hypothetical protein [Haloechinothrix sp. LS1_15]MDV6013580.1 hypothetical protein [Haloechinothrix sp. LS1_15]